MVQKQIQHRKGRVEGLTVDAFVIQTLGEQHVHLPHAADVVIHQPHFHALGALAYQNVFDFLEAGGVLHDEVFHEDELFRLFQILLHGLESVLSLAVIGDGGVFIHRPAVAVPKIPGLVGRGQILPFQIFQGGFRVDGNFVLHILPDGVQTLAHAGVA